MQAAVSDLLVDQEGKGVADASCSLPAPQTGVPDFRSRFGKRGVSDCSSYSGNGRTGIVIASYILPKPG